MSNTLNTLLRHKKFELAPKSHWRSMGHDGRYCEAMDNLQMKLINYIRRPSRSITLQPVDDNGNFVFGVNLQHDPHLSKMYKYLAIALIHREDCNIDSFRVIDVQLVPSVMAQVTKALTEKKLRSLVLHCNNLGPKGIIFVSEIVKHNASTLKCLSLNSNRIDDLGSAIKLAEVLDKHPFLDSLSLRYCIFGVHLGTIPVSAIISSCNNVKFLDLRNTDIGSEGAIVVSQFLATTPNPCMETINLSNNNLNVYDAEVISKGLSHNNILKLLYMSNNPISELGKRHLLRAIYDTTSLNHIIHSNHTCELIASNMHTAHEMVMLINNFTCARTNKKRKIVFAIHDAIVRRKDHCSLESVPVQLAPDVLGLIQFGPLKYMSSGLMFNYSFNLTDEVLRHRCLHGLFADALVSSTLPMVE